MIMSLIKKKKVIAHAKQEQNLFVLKLAIAGTTMVIKSLKSRRAIAITGRGWPVQLVSWNKRITIWHQGLAHASNTWVVRASKLTDGINFNTSNSEYNLTKAFINLNQSNASDSYSNSEIPTAINLIASNSIPIIAIFQEKNAKNPDNLDKLCTSCIRSKSAQVVRQNKRITITINKLEKMHTNLWELQNPLSYSGNIYLAIFMCKHTWKT